MVDTSYSDYSDDGTSEYDSDSTVEAENSVTSTTESTDLEEEIKKYIPFIVINAEISNLEEDEPARKKQKVSNPNSDMLESMGIFENGPSMIDRILTSGFSLSVKKHLVLEYNEKESSTSERVKFNNYLEKVLKIPVGKYKKINPGMSEVPKFMINLRKNLDEAIYGHNETKVEIIDYISSILRNPDSSTNILALQSPPGCGKTKFIRALGKALGLPFHQISFGGMNDPSILNGHDFTYIGSKPGKIYDVLAKAECMNSIIMLDEIDKIGDMDSPRSREVYGVLTHLLDKEQNNEFYDHYIGTAIPIDLSKILFIASFNNEYNIDPIVLNRMKVIKIKESSMNEKIDIVKKFTIPETISNLGLKDYVIKLDDKIIKYIIMNKTENEPGMRNINKNIYSLFGKINTLLYLEKACEEDRQNITKDLVYENVVLTRDGENSIIVTIELVDKFVPKRTSAMDLHMMYN